MNDQVLRVCKDCNISYREMLNMLSELMLDLGYSLDEALDLIKENHPAK